jgi:hypothetical protein
LGLSNRDAQRNNTKDNHCNIFDKMRVFLCQNLSAKYALGISNKNDAKNQSPIKTHICFAFVSSSVRKYIERSGIKFLL